MPESLLTLKLSGVLKFDGMTSFVKSLSDTRERENLLNAWSEDYLTFVNARHNRLSQGGAGWDPLSEEYTVADRRKRQRRGGDSGLKRGLNAILADTLQLLEATRKKGGRGQIRRLDVDKLTLTIGIGGTAVYRDPVRKRRRKRLGTIAKAHHEGGMTGNGAQLPRRPIIVEPNQATKNKLEIRAATWLRRLRNKSV